VTGFVGGQKLTFVEQRKKQMMKLLSITDAGEAISVED